MLIIGKIDDITGGGQGIIIRDTGEIVVAMPGDSLFGGDTVVSLGSNTLVEFGPTSGAPGDYVIGSGESATLDSGLFSLLSSVGSGPSGPTMIGSPIPTDLASLLETFGFTVPGPDTGINTGGQGGGGVISEQPQDPPSQGVSEPAVLGILLTVFAIRFLFKKLRF